MNRSATIGELRGLLDIASDDELNVAATVIRSIAHRFKKARAARKQNLIAQRFGRLVVVDYAGTDKRHNRMWRCRCECGATKIVYGGNLKKGLTSSCGCLRDAVNRAAHLKHGHASKSGRSRTYSTWRSMISRCTNRREFAYRYYGARGISVCARWLGDNGFRNFLSDMGERPDGKTLDRIDVNGNYEPTNCRWASPSEQARNTRANKLEPHEPEQIRWLRSLGYTLRSIAEFFDVHPRLVAMIVKGEAWA